MRQDGAARRRRCRGAVVRSRRSAWSAAEGRRPPCGALSGACRTGPERGAQSPPSAHLRPTARRHIRPDLHRPGWGWGPRGASHPRRAKGPSVPASCPRRGAALRGLRCTGAPPEPRRVGEPRGPRALNAPLAVFWFFFFFSELETIKKRKRRRGAGLPAGCAAAPAKGRARKSPELPRSSLTRARLQLHARVALSELFAALEAHRPAPRPPAAQRPVATGAWREAVPKPSALRKSLPPPGFKLPAIPSHSTILRFITRSVWAAPPGCLISPLPFDLSSVRCSCSAGMGLEARGGLAGGLCCQAL